MNDVEKVLDKHKKPTLIILDGLKISKAEENFFLDSLDKFHGLIPFETFVELNFSKDNSDEKIIGRVIVISFEQKFESTIEGINTKLIFTQMKENIYQQIRDWYQNWPMTRAGQIYYSILKETN